MIWKVEALGAVAICTTREEVWDLCQEWIARGPAPSVTIAILC